MGYQVGNIQFMNILDQEESMARIKGWSMVTSFSVGGFLYFGFSSKYPDKILIVSSQKDTILDCGTGMLHDCEAEIDEENHIAFCDLLADDFFKIYGQYGGDISQQTKEGESVFFKILGSHKVGDKELQIQQVSFVDRNKEHVVIHRGYLIYTCGFTLDGNYFVFADDGGIFVLKRQTKGVNEKI